MGEGKDIEIKTIEDLLANESFLAFCEQSNQQANNFWKDWIEEKEENKILAGQAMDLLKTIRLKEKQPESSEIEIELERLLSKFKK